MAYETVSVINEGSVCRGELEIQGIVHINGDFYGKIQAEGDVAIGHTGRAKCSIKARNVVVSGCIEGDIRISGCLRLHSSAIVVGNIFAASMMIEEGVILNGKIEVEKVSHLDVGALDKLEEEEKPIVTKEYSVWKK